MTASASSALAPVAIAATAALAAASGQPASTPLTRVALAYIEARFKLYLRFGEPARTHQLDRWRRSAVFLPGAVFCRIRWQANDYGTVRWQLMVMQACTPLTWRSASLACSRARACCYTPRATGKFALCWNALTPSRRWASRPPPSRPRTGARWATGSPRACRCPNTPPSGTPPG